MQLLDAQLSRRLVVLAEIRGLYAVKMSVELSLQILTHQNKIAINLHAGNKAKICKSTRGCHNQKMHDRLTKIMNFICLFQFVMSLIPSKHGFIN